MTEPTNADIFAIVSTLKLDVQDIKEDIHELNRRMGAVETRLGSVEETLEALSTAFDRDSEKVYGRERRITALELRFA